MVPLSLRSTQGPNRTCKGRALFPEPPAISMVSICKRAGLSGARPSPLLPLLPWPSPHTHSQVARYHWWKSCSLAAPFLLRFCPGTSSTQAGTE